MSTAPKTKVEAEADADFELPEGWATVGLTGVCELNPPKPPADALSPNTPVSFVPMPAVDAELGAITRPEARPFAAVRKGYTAFCENDVIMAKITPCMENGKAAIAHGLQNGYGFGSTEFHVLRSNGAVLPAYLYHFIRQESFRKAAEGEMTGSVGQKRVPAEFLENAAIPLAPLAEQKRIGKNLDQLIRDARLTSDRLGSFPGRLKHFRQSVLAAACSGKLTEGWREEHPEAESADKMLERHRERQRHLPLRKLQRRGSAGLPEIELPEDTPETWTFKNVRDLLAYGAILDFQDGNHGELYPRRSDFGQDGIIFLTATQVFDNKVFLDEAPRLSRAKASQLRIGFARPNDVLLTHNATVGRVAVLPPTDEKVILGTSVTYYRVNHDIFLPSYCCFAMQAPVWQQQLRAVMEQTTRNQVSVTKQIEFYIPIAPIDEQREIVRRVEALFKLADAIEKRVTAVTLRVEKLTQAILAKAFRGELVPTEAELARREGREYEPASVLLERIKEERAKAEQKPPKRVKKVKAAT